jgi:hypothetical protein
MTASLLPNELSHIVRQDAGAVLVEHDGGAHRGVGGLVERHAVGGAATATNASEVHSIFDEPEFDRLGDFAYSGLRHVAPLSWASGRPVSLNPRKFVNALAAQKFRTLDCKNAPVFAPPSGPQ